MGGDPRIFCYGWGQKKSWFFNFLNSHNTAISSCFTTILATAFFVGHYLPFANSKVSPFYISLFSLVQSLSHNNTISKIPSNAEHNLTFHPGLADSPPPLLPLPRLARLTASTTQPDAHVSGNSILESIHDLHFY